MVLVNVHPDYINFDERKSAIEEFNLSIYTDFLNYIKKKYGSSYWNCLPKELAASYNRLFQKTN